MVMIATVHYSNNYFVQRSLLKGNWKRYFVEASILLLVLSFLRYMLERYLFPPQIQPSFFRDNPFRPLFFVATVAIVGFVSSTILYLIHLSKKERELLQVINVQNEARLQYLQMQIKPHFLFNALNNIYSLVITNSKQAPDMLLHLTELLRYSIYEKKRGLVAVSEEARQIEFLIELFSLKSDEPYNISFTRQITHGAIEPMILIPLAENCLKHCDFDLNKNAFVTLHLVSDAGNLLFETENTYTATQQNNNPGGVGLQNIKERLHLIYGQNASFSVSATGSIFKTQLKILWKNWSVLP